MEEQGWDLVDSSYIDFIWHGGFGQGSKRMGGNTWRLLTERWTGTAKSVFLFDVQGSVAKSAFAGLAWLLYLRSGCKRPIYFWPFDGWEVPQAKSVVGEVYPALWMRRLERDGRGMNMPHTQRRRGCNAPTRNGSLGSYFNSPLTPKEREVADVEGWILGLV